MIGLHQSNYLFFLNVYTQPCLTRINVPVKMLRGLKDTNKPTTGRDFFWTCLKNPNLLRPSTNVRNSRISRTL